MGSGAIEIYLDVLLQNVTQLSLAEYEHVVEALPAYRTKEARSQMGFRLGERGGIFTTSIVARTASLILADELGVHALGEPKKSPATGAQALVTDDARQQPQVSGLGVLLPACLIL